jgi:hypothetical protein
MVTLQVRRACTAYTDNTCGMCVEQMGERYYCSTARLHCIAFVKLMLGQERIRVGQVVLTRLVGQRLIS